jgi:hypothetical protein
MHKAEHLANSSGKYNLLSQSFTPGQMQMLGCDLDDQTESEPQAYLRWLISILMDSTGRQKELYRRAHSLHL